MYALPVTMQDPQGKMCEPMSIEQLPNLALEERVLHTLLREEA